MISKPKETKEIWGSMGNLMILTIILTVVMMVLSLLTFTVLASMCPVQECKNPSEKVTFSDYANAYLLMIASMCICRCMGKLTKFIIIKYKWLGVAELEGNKGK